MLVPVASGSYLLRERQKPGQGNADPGGAVVEFVEKFVERLLQQIGVEQKLRLGRLRNKMRVLADGGLVGGEELGGDGVLPQDGPGLEGAGVGRGVGGTALHGG